MVRRGEILGELYELKDDIEEWLQTLEKEGEKNGKIWADLKFREVVGLVEELLEDFKKNLSLLKDGYRERRKLQKFGEGVEKAIKWIKRRSEYED